MSILYSNLVLLLVYLTLGRGMEMTSQHSDKQQLLEKSVCVATSTPTFQSRCLLEMYRGGPGLFEM